MRGYNGIELSSSACVRFVRNDDMDGPEHEVFEQVHNRGMRCAYVDLSSANAQGEMLANQIANALHLEHAPYTDKHWVCFLDDLITLAHREQGLVIVVDGAWLLIEKRRGTVRPHRGVPRAVSSVAPATQAVLPLFADGTESRHFFVVRVDPLICERRELLRALDEQQFVERSYARTNADAIANAVDGLRSHERRRARRDLSLSQVAAVRSGTVSARFS